MKTENRIAILIQVFGNEKQFFCCNTAGTIFGKKRIFGVIMEKRIERSIGTQNASLLFELTFS